MRHQSRLAVLAAAVVGVSAGLVRAEQFLSPTDFIIALDATADSHSAYPGDPAHAGNEGPLGAFDNDVTTKYLNFGRRGTGVIFGTNGASTVKSLQLFSANDAQERDPASYVLFGTNDAVASVDNSNGLGGEAWTLIQQGVFSPPSTGGPLNDGRQAPYAPINLTNSTSYTSYKLYFPKVRAGNANSMQVSEIHFFDANDAGGTQILPDFATIKAIDNPQSDSAYIFAERPQLAIDGNLTPASGTGRYRNGLDPGGNGTPISAGGLIITPKRGKTILNSFTLETASDQPARDPTSYQIYGTNDPIVSEDNESGNSENWTLLGSGSITPNATRNFLMPAIPVNAAVGYTSYKVVFPTVNGSSTSLQIGELMMDGILLGEPEWNVDSSGDWNNGGNWSGALPNGPDAVAGFLGKSTSPHTVYTDTAVTVGRLKFNNANTYVLAGNGSLTMQVTSGSATIDVASGSHKINLPLFINSNTNIVVASGATLTIGNPTVIAAGKTLANNGLVQVQAPLSIAAAGALAIQSGRTTLGSVPTLGAGAKVDVMTSELLVNYQGGSSPADSLRAQLVAGYNDGNWNAAGITTSSAIAGHTGLGWKDDVASQSILVKYTYYGDSNLDGKVDVTDLGALATNWQGHNVWAGGDFNYDGLVDVSDLGALATNWQAGVASPLGGGSLEAALAAVGLGGVSVPEPTASGLLLAGIAAAASRRRARARRS